MNSFGYPRPSRGIFSWLPFFLVSLANDSVPPGSAPASGAVVGALAHHRETRNPPHRSAPAGAIEPTGEGAGRNTRGRVCSPD
jgi:hypothetical protein